LLTGERCNYGLPLPIYTLYDDKNRQMVLAQNGEIRWFDDVKNPPVKTGKISEVPAFDYSPEEKKAISDAVKLHQSMFGDIPQNFFESATLIQRPGGKEFCLTDRDSKFYFYSTATGELLRKVIIQKPKHKRAPMITALSDDNKIVLTQSTELNKAYVHNMETGKLIFEFDSQFLDSVGLTPDGSTVIQIRNKNVLSRYSTRTGKKSDADLILQAESAGNIVVSPSGGKIAFNLYAKGDSNGQAILDLATDTIIACDPTLKKFSTLAFTPDGKYLAVTQPKYMHFIDTTTGKHSFSYNAGYPDIWDVVTDPSFSPDSTKISFRPANGIDVNLPYYVYCDLSQPRKKLLDKLGP
jgi:WD40 repeat protein